MFEYSKDDPAQLIYTETNKARNCYAEVLLRTIKLALMKDDYARVSVSSDGDFYVIWKDKKTGRIESMQILVDEKPKFPASWMVTPEKKEA